MDPRQQCAGFSPPPPMRMDAYLDEVTGGKTSDLDRVSVFALDQALQAIAQRPTLSERAALKVALEQRFIAYGERHRWLNTPRISEEEKKDLLASFILKDIIGLKGANIDEKLRSQLEGMIKDYVKECLNARGKRWFEFLEKLGEMTSAKSWEELGKIIAKLPLKPIGEWISQNWINLGRSFSWPGVSGAVRNRIIKVIAARLTWCSVLIRRLNPYILFLDLFLTSESIASNDDEARLTFLILYARVVSSTQEQLGKLVSSCASPDWQFRSLPTDSLKKQIATMR